MNTIDVTGYIQKGEYKLMLEIFPLQDPPKIYFDDESTKKEGTVAKVKQIQLIPEYQFDFNISANGLEYITQ